MNEFEVGDKIRCIHVCNSASWLHLSEEYVIHKVYLSGNIEVVNDEGYYDCHWTPDQFELITQTLPSVAEQRKATPVYSGVLRYFPDALQAVAQCSKVGNDQHNPGEPLHWARGKSGDELDALTRHLLDAGTMDTDGVRHSTKVAWRALANLQKELEAAGETDGTTTSGDAS